jgi:hydrogenase assembly chaperone HypC/HupF
MCLAIPGKIVEKQERDGALIGRVDFGGALREVYLDFVPEAEVGDYVIVHVGFALSSGCSGKWARSKRRDSSGRRYGTSDTPRRSGDPMIR